MTFDEQLRGWITQQTGMTYGHGGGGSGSGPSMSYGDWRALSGMATNAPVETRLDWKELNKFSLYTPILRVIGDAARKCGAEARFVQTENFLDDCAELMIELRRGGETTLLDFNTLVQMIEDQGTLAADFSGVRRIVGVSCSLLPNPKPKVEEQWEDSNQAKWAKVAALQQSMSQQQQMAQYQNLAKGLADASPISPAKEFQSWSIDRLKAYLGLKP